VAVTDPSFPDTLINGVPVVATPAEIDITTADQLCAALLHAAGDGHPVIVVDMTGTRFCDSAGLHTVTAAYKRVRADGSELRLVLPAGGSVPRVFALTGIDRFVPCFADLEEAVAKPPRRADMQPMAPAALAEGSDARLRRSL
jgi:anti-sigma B factor antagonist